MANSCRQWPQTNCHTMIPKNCLGFFQGAFNGLPWNYFSEKTSVQLGQIQKSDEFFFVKLNDSLEYIKLLNLVGFLELFNCKVLDATSKLTQWFEKNLFTKRQGTLGYGGDRLVG